ncbi:MAG: metallophosphoesterase family protein [Nitrososphaera sp.]|uniref:metallophosphoesterase family protein n=1 Tax=Nitrososphaera sp. TaxID=1971748 RepID=UPI003D6DF333
MLVAHISDLHLGYSQFNLEEREEDVYQTFNEAIDISIKEGVGLVILAGDIFHTPRPSGKAVITLANALKKLKEKQIPVVFVLGEHDISRMRDVPFAYIFSNLGLARRLKLDEPYTVGDCTIFGADKERRSNIDSLVARLQNAGCATLSAGKKKILVLHQGLTDLNKFAGELNSTDMPAGFDYYAMGHYHDHIEKRYANLGGPLVYPGSLDLTPSEGIKEVEKGFALVDMSGEETSVQFIPLQMRRPQFTIKVDFAKMQEGMEDVIKKASSYGSKKPVVKVQVEGRNIDSRAVAASLLKLNEECLHYVWQSVDEQAQALAFDERPADLDAELLRLSKDALGSEESATLAIRDLLPPASAGDVSATLEIVWDIFKKRSAT